MSELMKHASGLLVAIPMFLVWWLAFGVLERLFPAVEHKPLKGWFFNFSTSVLYVIAGSLAGFGSVIVGDKVQHYLHGGLIDLRLRNTDGFLGRFEATLLFFFIFDFFYYWWHRYQHKLPALWAIHKLHHMDEGINVSTNLRHHWIEDLARVPTIVVPMAILFHLSPRSGGAAGMVFAGWTYFFHSNLRLNLGRFSWVLNAPQTHRIHHSRLPEHYDKNFAAFFPIWDVIFGTYFHPRRGEFPPTGVPDEPAISNMWDASMLPFRTWRR
jgi:sterol desaturase/sphingolipid hydroxylase (fatty acid hydroxylase superfamily)